MTGEMQHKGNGEMISVKRKKLYLFIQAFACVLLAVLLIAAAADLYLTGSARKAENPTESVFKAELVMEKAAEIVPLFFAVLGFGAAGLILGAKEDCAEKPGQVSVKPCMPAAPVKHVGVLRGLVLTAALALILLGILNGSARDVLIKAITICSECIGLG